MKVKSNWITQSVAAKAMGIDPKTFRTLGVEPAATHAGAYYYDVAVIVQSAIERRLSDVVHDDGHELDLKTEQAKLARATRIEKELKNEKTQGNQAPIGALEYAMGSVVSQISSIMISIPLNIKANHPEIPTAVIRQIEREITKAQNAMATVDIDWSGYQE